MRGTAKTMVINARNVDRVISHVTVTGTLLTESPEDAMKLARLMRAYREAVRAMLNYVWRGHSHVEAAKALHDRLPNYVYLETAFKQAKLVAEGVRYWEETGRRILAGISKLWVASRGNRWDGGNRNVKLVPSGRWFSVFIKYPWDGSWIRARALFGSRYLSLLSELVELAVKGRDGYGVVVSFEERLLIHVQVPVWLYLKHFTRHKPRGYGLLAGFDLNSDRVNMAVVDGSGEIVAVKTAWFPEVTSHGFPRDAARQRRLQAIARLLDYAASIGVDYMVFENLFTVKKRSRVGSPRGNRRIARFAKREMLQHAILSAVKRGFTVVLVDPKGTTHSREHREAMKKRGLDKHMASAYIIATKGLKVIKNH